MGSGPAPSQGATHGLALPVSRAQVEQPRDCPIGTAMSPNTAAGRLLRTHRPPSRWPGGTREACPERARSSRMVLPRAPTCRTLVPTAHQCGPDRCRHLPRPTRATAKIQRLHECGLCARAPKDGDFYGPKNEKPVSSSSRKSQVKSLISETEFTIYKYTETWSMQSQINRCSVLTKRLS